MDTADPRPTPPLPLADLRLNFSPSYILVGVYRLSTDASIRVPVWKKCKHGFVRGALVGLAWVSADDHSRQATQPTPFPCLISPGVLHVWNSKKLHPALPVKVRSVLTTNHGVHSHPLMPDPHARPVYLTTPSLAIPSPLNSRHVCAFCFHIPSRFSPSNTSTSPQWPPSLLSEIK